MFLTDCKPASANAAETRVPTCSRTVAETQIPPGSASACSRAATLTASPNRSPSRGHNVAAMNADAEQHPPVRREILVLLGDRALDRDRAGEPVDGARELGEQRVAGGIGDAAAMLGDQRLDDRAARGKPATVLRPRPPASAGCIRRRRRRGSSSDDARHAAASERFRRAVRWIRPSGTGHRPPLRDSPPASAGAGETAPRHAPGWRSRGGVARARRRSGSGRLGRTTSAHDQTFPIAAGAVYSLRATNAKDTAMTEFADDHVHCAARPGGDHVLLPAHVRRRNHQIGSVRRARAGGYEARRRHDVHRERRARAAARGENPGAAMSGSIISGCGCGTSMPLRGNRRQRGPNSRSSRRESAPASASPSCAARRTC